MLWLAFIAELGLAIARQLQDERVAPSVRGRLEREVLAAWGDIIARADIPPEQLPFLDQVLEQAIIPPGYIPDESGGLICVFDPVIHIVDDEHPLLWHMEQLSKKGTFRGDVPRIFMHTAPTPGLLDSRDFLIQPAIDKVHTFAMLEKDSVQSDLDKPWADGEEVLLEHFRDFLATRVAREVVDTLGMTNTRNLFNAIVQDRDPAEIAELEQQIYIRIREQTVVPIDEPYVLEENCPECGGALEATTGEGAYTVYQLCPQCDWSNWRADEPFYTYLMSWRLGSTYECPQELSRRLHDQGIFLSGIEPWPMSHSSLIEMSYIDAAQRALQQGFVLMLVQTKGHRPRSPLAMRDDRDLSFTIIDPWPAYRVFTYQGAAPEQAAQTKKLLDSLFRSRR